MSLSESSAKGSRAPRAALSILVVGTDDWAIEQGAESIAAAGHRVLTCHEPGQPAFPCNALRPGGVCPLDVTFDAVVTMRSRPASPPGDHEFGAICGLHAGAPLIVAGFSHDNPFEDWAAAVVERSGDIVDAIAQVVQPAVDLTEVALP